MENNCIGKVYFQFFISQRIGKALINLQISGLPPLTKATEVSPTNLRARLGRAWSRAKTTYYTCAIKDIDIALATSPLDLRAIQLKAYFTFLRTDFEDAFVQNQRGIPKRKMPNGFLIGAMQVILFMKFCFWS